MDDTGHPSVLESYCHRQARMTLWRASSSLAGLLSSVPKTRQTCTELTLEAMHLCSCAALLGASLGVSVTIAGCFFCRMDALPTSNGQSIVPGGLLL